VSAPAQVRPGGAAAFTEGTAEQKQEQQKQQQEQQQKQEQQARPQQLHASLSVQCTGPDATAAKPRALFTAAVAPDRWSNMMNGPPSRPAHVSRLSAKGNRTAGRHLLNDLDSGWNGLGARRSEADTVSSEAVSASSLDPALAVGKSAAGKGFALHSVNSQVVVYALDLSSGRPFATHAPRRLSSFFASSGFGFGNQTGYQNPSAAFDKASQRFVLAAVSQAPASQEGRPHQGPSSVLWIGASTKTDPRQSWRIAALAAPVMGDVNNPCGGDRAAVWESPQIGYDSFGIHVGVTLACAVPGSTDPDARTNHRTWLLSFDKTALYRSDGPTAVTLAGWEMSSGVVSTRFVQPAVPQAAEDVEQAASGAAFAVALVSFFATEAATCGGVSFSNHLSTLHLADA